VRITSRRAGDMLEVSVVDNGPGIPADTLPNLFRAFSSSKGDGLGLGLAISRTIAQTHGGDLKVDAGAERVNDFGTPGVMRLASKRV
jgi:two-component system, LuxR family, sensor kinase FixL